MWDFLSPASRHYLISHKQATLSWTDSCLNVQYESGHHQTSAGFRVEVYLEANTRYKLEIDVKLLIGDVAFIYVEHNGNKLLPRHKIYQSDSDSDGSQDSYTFVVPEESVIPVYLGILFYHPDQDYSLEVRQFKLTKEETLVKKSEEPLVKKLTESNIQQLAKSLAGEETTYYQPSEVHSILSSSNQPPPPIKLASQYLIPSQNISRPRMPNQSVLVSEDFSPLSNWDHSTQYSRGLPNQLRRKQAEQSNLMTDLIIPSDESPRQKEVVESWFPLSVGRNQLFEYQERLKVTKTKIYVSLTTIPSRLGKITPVVDSLLKQSIPISKIYLVIPKRYRRTDRPYLIDNRWYFKADPRVQILRENQQSSKININNWRGSDLGPMSKLYPVLNEVTNPNSIILTADDDQIYPPHWAYFLTFLPLRYPNYRGVYGLKGYLNHKMVISQQNSAPVNVDWLTGDFGVAYPRKWIKNQSKLLKQVTYSREAFYSDNLLIGNHLAQSHVARIVIPQVNYELVNQVYPKKTSWANGRDSLHKMKPPQSVRHSLVLNILKKKKHHYLNYLGYPMKRLTETGLITTSAQTDTEDVTQQTDNHQSTTNRQVMLPEENREEVKRLLVENSQRMVLSQNAKVNASIFDRKKVRYISYLTNIYHPEWVLLYLRKIQNATLELPKLPYNVSLPNVYGEWFEQNPNDYDVIIVDLPFSFERIQLKTKKPIFYIYRYPQIGNPMGVVDQMTGQHRNSLDQSLPPELGPQLIINTHYHSVELNDQNTHLWRVMPELQIKNVGSVWSREVKHLGLIVTDGYYVENLDLMIAFWKDNCQQLPIKLHLGVTTPLNQRIQTILNQQGIKNINIYTQSNLFGALIYKCDYYFSLGYHLDLYAVWAHQNNKSVIKMRTGEFKDYPRVIPIPFKYGGQQSVCPEMVIDHSRCREHSGCSIYGLNQTKTVNKVPEVNLGELKSLFDRLFTKDGQV